MPERLVDPDWFHGGNLDSGYLKRFAIVEYPQILRQVRFLHPTVAELSIRCSDTQVGVALDRFDINPVEKNCIHRYGFDA